MQQRQLRLGDILDDYCPRERRVTNHAIVAMIGEDVKQVRCTTCDADHAFKHAKVPRQRTKGNTPAALYAQVLATGPKRVVQEAAAVGGGGAADNATDSQASASPSMAAAAERETSDVPQALDPEETDADALAADSDPDGEADGRDEEAGPVHRPLIRASLPRIDGQPPPARQMPEFTIRQPGGRPSNRFRPRHQSGGSAGGGGGQQFQGNRSHGGNMPGGPRGGMRSNGGRPPQGPGGASTRRHGPGRRRSK